MRIYIYISYPCARTLFFLYIYMYFNHGQTQLAAVRDEAKKELDTANKELKQLEMDVNAGMKAAAAAPVDREELIEEFRKVSTYPQYNIYIHKWRKRLRE
jgi:hypothetical protein